MQFSYFITILLIKAFEVTYCGSSSANEANTDEYPSDIYESNTYDLESEYPITNDDYSFNYKNEPETEVSTIHLIRLNHKFKVSCQNITYFNNTV